MARTPDDPTKAQAWLWGTPPDLEMELYIPRGAKGEPGGIVLGTLLGTADLNSIVTPGVYRQADSSGNSSGTTRNYPTSGGYGTVVVYQTHSVISDVVQEYYPQSYNAAHDARLMYRRNRSNNIWSPWRVYRSSRVDQTVGRVIYEWDDLNNREQLVYGDTGWRNVASDSTFLPALTSGTNIVLNGGVASVRRKDYHVELSWAVSKTINGTFTADAALPYGFRVPQIMNFVGWNSSFNPIRVYCSGGANAFQFQNNAVGGAYTITASWETTDNWPTSLPGTASGSIPNV